MIIKAPSNFGVVGKLIIFPEFIMTLNMIKEIMCYLPTLVTKRNEIIMDENGFTCNNIDALIDLQLQ